MRHLTGTVVPIPDPGVTLPEYHLPWCFGCGPENDHGLGISPRLEDDRVVAELEFAPWFQGGPGVVHGGAIAAFFDDLMGFVMLSHLAPGVTAKLEINYLQPIPLGTTIRGEAWLSGRDGRKLWAEAIGCDASGMHYVEARALFVQIGDDHYARIAEAITPEQQERAARYQEGRYYP
jgi:acyl-coenzyme A thioesterase PaaI-like protein